MLRVTLIGWVAALLLLAGPAFAEDATPPKLDRPAEIMVIGQGEVMNALHRVVEDEVAIINGDGGVMGQPLKVTRVDEPCDGSAEASSTRARSIAERQPLVVFQSYCEGSGLDEVAVFAERHTLFMGVGSWPAALTGEHRGATVFRLAPNHRVAQEWAFHLASTGSDHFELVFKELDRKKIEAVADELRRGFAATKEETEAWGELLAAKTPVVELLELAVDGATSIPAAPNDTGPTTLMLVDGADQGPSELQRFVDAGWKGNIVVPDLSKAIRNQPDEWEAIFKKLPEGVKLMSLEEQPFYLGEPPEGAKSYTAFHPDWVAGFWQVMKAVKYARSLDGGEIAAGLGGPPFFSRAPWLMLQSSGRFVPPALRQRFNDNGDLRLAGFQLKRIWPK